MSDDSKDQMLLMAQMMADSDSPNVRARLDSYLPLIFIVVVGIIISGIALYSAKLWEDHVESNINKTSELAYINEVNRNLFNMRQNTNAMAGMVAASNYISQEEFSEYADWLLRNQLTTQFITLLHYKNQNYLEPPRADDSRLLINHINEFIKNNRHDPGFGPTKEAFFILKINDGAKSFIVHTLLFDNSNLDQPLILASATRVQTLTEGIHDDLPLLIHIKDVFGNEIKKSFFGGENDPTLHAIQHTYQDLEIELAIPNSISVLQSAIYLKWILILFSIAFTLTLSIQFILAQRSMKQLANLAVQRANALTAINSDLTDEILSRIEFQSELLEKNQEIQSINSQLEEAQNQLIQQEKLASLGQLAAGVAHEINNPVGFINSNLTMLAKYTDRALQLIHHMEQTIESQHDEAAIAELNKARTAYKYKSLKNNIMAVIDESLEGVDRVKQIVQDLKNFSRIDEAEWQWADIHAGIESTLNIAWNEIKYKAEVHKEYGELPNIECVPSQINQVIMNLLVNSAHAMEEPGNIYIRTSSQEDKITIQVEDDGSGISDDIIGKIFDPFFTTKEVGKGTGLGLSLSYGIIKKHNGELTVVSTPGKGTVFTIVLPVSRNHSEHKAA